MDSFMLEMEGFKQDLAEVRRMIEETGKSLQIDHLREQLVEYREDMGSTGFWDDLERAQKVSAKAHGVERRIQHYESLITRADDVEVMMELADEEDDESMVGEIKGEMKKIEWGSQIRSYVFQPYTLVKDHRTGHEEGNISEVMDGKLEGFVIDYLQKL